jgi:hypothetical protein
MIHEFVDMPGRSLEMGDNPNENVMMLRCKWCMKTPISVHDNECPMRELEQNGYIVLHKFNPTGAKRFLDRTCITCNKPIMDHYMKKGSINYWCNLHEPLYSLGLSETVWDVPEGFGQEQAPIIES